MKKVFTAGFISIVFGFLAITFVIGGGLVGADTTTGDPSAELFKILLYLGGGFAVLGIILIASAATSLRR